MAKKILFLLGEQPEQELSFFYTAAALSHIYRFIVSYQIESGDFPFYMPARAAFFPGTFDPFSLSHKGIVQELSLIHIWWWNSRRAAAFWGRPPRSSHQTEKPVSTCRSSADTRSSGRPVSYTHLAARKVGGQHQVPARCLGVQIAGGVHQHAPHAAVQAVWMGAEMGQQVIEPAVHAALIQGDDKQEPPSRQRTLQAGQDVYKRQSGSGTPATSPSPASVRR